MHGDVIAQLRQRVAELTPFAEEAGSLRLWEAEARQDVEEAEKVFEELCKGAVG